VPCPDKIRECAADARRAIGESGRSAQPARTMSVPDLPCAEQSAPPMDYLAGSTAKIFIKFLTNLKKKLTVK